MSPAVQTSLPQPRRRAALALLTDDTGATAVEYGLIAALIVLAILSGLRALGADMANLPLQAIIDGLQSVL